MSKKLIVVFGATGQQGGSVVNALLKSGKWNVRGVTRDPESKTSKALKEKGVEVVKAHCSNKEEVENAVDGAFGVFAMTSFWDKEIFGKQLLSEEQKQGELMASASLAKGVKHFIFSSLPDTKTISKGKLNLHHFTGKNLAEQYARKLSKENPDFISSFFYAGFYCSNLPGMHWVSRDSEGVIQWKVPLKKDSPIELFDVDDTGPLVSYMFNHPQEYSGKIMYGTSEAISASKMGEIFASVIGEKVVPSFYPTEALRGKMPDELVDNMLLIDEYGLFNREDVSGAKKVYPQITTFEQWLKKSGWKG